MKSYSSMSSILSVSHILLLFLLLHLLLAVKCQRKPLAPALFVFGDSLVDSGNSDYLNTTAKGKYKPYGVDFRGGCTGRFTNGNTLVDYIAELLNLPYAPPYLSLPDVATQRSKISVTGVNYASAAAGIRKETGRRTGETLSFGKQIDYFQTTKNDLLRMFKTPEELPKHLAKSIYFIAMGTNDYINNYLQPDYYSSSRTTLPQKYAYQLLDGLKEHLTVLYNSGARKFIVFGLAPLGCLPGIVNTVKPKTPCVEEVNNKLVKLFNNDLPDTIQQLTSSLKGSTFIHGNIYQLSYDQNQNPSKFGYTAGRVPCCILEGNGTTSCTKDSVPCNNRSTHLWWDAYHPTSRVNREVANACFNGSSPCVPINIQKLLQK